MTDDAKPVVATAAATLPLIEDVLHVGTREVDTGGWRISKTVDSRQEVVDALLRERRVVVERRPVGLTLPEGSAMPEQRYEGDVLVIPVVEEVLVTATRLLVVEEVRVTRLDDHHRSPQQVVTLRREQVSIERLAADGTSAAESS